MGLFDRKPKENTKVNKEKQLSSDEYSKLAEEAKKREAEQKQKELEIKQFNETEDIDDFITDDEVDNTDITKVIIQFLEDNGTEETINYLNSVVTRLFLESREDNSEKSKQDDEQEIEFKE